MSFATANRTSLWAVKESVWGTTPSNPAFKPLTELISRLGLSMNDLGMTVRANDDEDEKGMGLLKLDEKDKETLSAFGQRMLQATENARGLIEQAQRATKADPVLVEHQARGGDK